MFQYNFWIMWNKGKFVLSSVVYNEFCDRHIWDHDKFTVQLQETIIYYPGFSETEGNEFVFIEDVYK